LIHHIRIYDDSFSSSLIQDIVNSGDPTPPKPAASSKEAPIIGVLLTTDERICTSVCTTNPIPGSPNAPSPPKDARLG